MVNKVFLIGRLGKDPVVKKFDNGGSIVEFSLATDDSYKDKQGNKVEQTDWHNIRIPFKGLADIAEKYLKKGSQIFLEGKVKTREYNDKDGNKRYITEIVADNFRMLDGKKSSGGGSDSGSSDSSFSATASTSSGSQQIDDDLPF